MLKAIKRIAKRIFIFILVVFVIYLVISNIDWIREMASADRISVMVDADAAHTPEDVIAICRLLLDDDIELRGISSAQWRLADLNNDSTVQLNGAIHKILLREFDRERIPEEPGAAIPLAYQEKTDNPNRAAEAIIRVVKQIPYEQKLSFICMGSATNLASAILKNPDIIKRTVCYLSGPNYDPERRTWNKNDPYSRLDLDAMDVLLNCEGLELHLLPANVGSQMKLAEADYREVLETGDSLRSYIMLRSFSASDTIEAASLALTEAFRNPDLTTQKQLLTPPENTQRKIYVYTRLDETRMQKDLLRKLSK